MPRRKGAEVPKFLMSRGKPPVIAMGLVLLLAGCGTTERLLMPGFGSGGVAEIPTDSLTVQRIRGAPVAPADVLRVEPGNVWPEQEGQRATMAEPDAVLRGLPPATFPEAPRQPPLQRIPPRADGQVIQTPQGGTVTTGGNDRVQSTLSPQGAGVAVRDGGTVTVIEPGQPPRLLPAPR